METRVAVISIIVEDFEKAEDVNAVLHEFGSFIIGRMGIPYKDKNINIISVAVDAPMNIINNISGKIGKINGVSAKAICSTK